ncbi:MAG: nucleoside hydrolase [Chthonomonadales bacterium]|nr:nucleoside hydrolase [Chthonomonadales bacterium]
MPDVERGPSRREVLAAAAACAAPAADTATPRPRRVPVIDITDLYHPAQDPGDNVDLIAAYGLPEVELRAVVLDVSQRYRRPHRDAIDPAYSDPTGPRDGGFIPVAQLNYIFGRDVPCAAGPFEPMRHPGDTMRDAAAGQQAGVDLLLRALRASREPVDVVSFGSLRPLAVALNRDPELLRARVRRVHVCAGSMPAPYLEWNVRLDPHAFVRLLRSELPIALYPCATDGGAFALGEHNTYWRLADLGMLRRLHPRLQSYLCYALGRSQRIDFLNAIDDPPPPGALERLCPRPHHVWETAVWTQVSGRRLVRRADGTHRLLSAGAIGPGDAALPQELRPVCFEVSDAGDVRLRPAAGLARGWIYWRGDPAGQQAALQEALPALYTSFTPA